MRETVTVSCWTTTSSKQTNFSHVKYVERFSCPSIIYKRTLVATAKSRCILVIYAGKSMQARATLPHTRKSTMEITKCLGVLMIQVASRDSRTDQKSSSIELFIQVSMNYTLNTLNFEFFCSFYHHE